MAAATEPRGGNNDPFSGRWQAPQLEKLARSISKDNLTLVPLQRVSSTLQDVKKNGEALMLTAHNAVQRLRPDGKTEAWQGPTQSIDVVPPNNTRSLSNSSGRGRRRLLRKSASEANLRQGPVRPVRVKTTVEQSSHSSRSNPQSPQGLETFDWLNAFNEKLNTARRSSGTSLGPRGLSQLQLPLRESFEQQAKHLMHSASGVNLEKVASQLMEKPKEVLNTAQQTLTICQNNLQTLQLNLKQSLSERRASFEQHLNLLSQDSNHASQSLPTYFHSLMQRGSGLTEAVVVGQSDETDKEDAGEASVPIKRASGEKDVETQSQQSQLPWGPFQEQAQRRREKASRRPGGSSSLREQGRHITIVTTASLPWMTGTAVNPLLRAAYLAQGGGRDVTLMIPWLSEEDQKRIFPNNMTFHGPEDQEQYVRDWVKKRTGFPAQFNVTFYPGRYAPEKCSILPVGDPTAYVSDAAADVAILEEPEHLTWYHHGKRWTDKFAHVVGIVHTNYLDYARREDGGKTKEMLLKHINGWVTRVHCHKVVKLSDAVQDLPRQTTQFVHGVAESFLKVGEKKAAPSLDGGPRFSRGAYFLGKCVWAKGYTELLDLLAARKAHDVHVDCYGTGEDLEAVRREANERKLALEFHGAKDHLDESIHEYRVFVNPSTSDVVATTTAEALAMGKWVVCADHPSNAFFSQFKNCLIYKTPEEFESSLRHAMSVDPQPLTQEDRMRLTWEAATERFLDVAELRQDRDAITPLQASIDTVAWVAHNTLCGIEPLRQVAGAGANTKNNPASVTDYKPSASDLGGLFDDRRRAVKAYGSSGSQRAELPAPQSKGVCQGV